VSDLVAVYNLVSDEKDLTK